MSTEPTGFTVEIGQGMTLTVIDSKSPLWHGPYKDGLLTIYRAEVDGSSTELYPPSGTVAFIAAYCETGATEDFLTFTWYDIATPVTTVMEDIQRKIFDQYCACKAQMTIAAASNSSRTIH